MRKLVLFLLLLIPFIIMGFIDPYARRIRPFTSVPVACAENEIGYSMTLHKPYICTNAGYKELLSSVTAAPIDATYITQTANASLTNEQALSSLSTGIMRVATTTGVITSLTDSAGIFSNISDETGGTGVLVGNASPTFTGTVVLPITTFGGNSFWTSSGLMYAKPASPATTNLDLVSLDAGTPQFNGNGAGIRLASDGSTNGVITFATNKSGIGSGVRLTIANDGASTFVSSVNASAFGTATNCADSAGAAACGSASSGSFVIDATTTATVVSTTAVTANSQIILQEDSSLGTRLGVTCNTQSSLTLGALRVTARTAATSFTATIEAGPTTNPMCVNYTIIN